MKRYNLSEIMKNAWRAFKMKSNTKTFGECLKSTWMLAKLSARVETSVKKGVEQFKSKMNTAKSVINRDSVFNNLNLDSSAFYGNNKTGNGRFVND